MFLDLDTKAANAANWARRAAPAVVGGIAALASQAHAELPAEVTTSIGTYKTDALAAIGAVMAAGVVIWGLMKLKSKMGW